MAEYGIEEDDELARIKEWWRNNGLSLVLGAVVGIGAIVGWQGWQAWQENRAGEASAAYARVQAAIAGSEAGPDKIAALTEKLQSNYGASPYAAQAGLARASYLADRGAREPAIESLQWVVDYAEQPPLRHIARVRQARLLWGQDQPDAALKRLQHDHPAAFTPLYAELAGDIHADAGRNDKARAAYDNALSNLPPDADAAPIERKLATVSNPNGAGNTNPEAS